jgi:PAS domain S-box-containing protein
MQATLQSEEQLRQISDHLPEVIFLFDIQMMRFVYASRAFERLLGRPREMLYADRKSFFPAVAPEDLPAVNEAIEHMKRGERATVEFRVRRPDGEVVQLRARTFPVFDDTGTIVRVAGIAEDITRDAVYRDQLREHTRRLKILHETAVRLNEAENQVDIYALLLEQMRQVIHFDSGSVLLVRDGQLYCVAAIGFPLSAAAADRWIPLNPLTPSLQVVTEGRTVVVEDMPRAYPQFAERSPAIAAKIRSWLGVPLIWRGITIGEIALDRWQVQPFEQEDEELATVIANHAAGAIERARLHSEELQSNEQLERRVTERTLEIEQAQSSIRTLMERLQLATRSAGIGIWDWDMVHQTIYWDDNMRRMYGVPEVAEAGEMMSNWLDWIHPDDRAYTEAMMYAAMSQGQTADANIRVVTHAGDVRHVRVIATILRDKQGVPQRMIGVCTDITKEREADLQRAQTEENLRKSEEHLRLINAELERAARLKDEFLANMSHELRTPLNAMLIIGESLQEEVYGEINAQQRRALTDVVESGQHLLALINDILDLSKIEAGKVELQYSAVNIAGVCQASLRLVREQALKKGHSVSLLLPSDSLTVLLDERRLKQMLVNLLSNAVKFTPNDGRIGLEVSLGPSQPEIHFAVWDTGIGIPEDKLGRLFQPFAQLDGALNRQYGGTGLGLALVRRLAELHGGRIEVQSTPGAGSRFTITLPI